jgi:hypothetical protein
VTPSDLITLAIVPALSILPERMDTVPARAMLVAIALQESGLRHRVQVGGPARGWWQFEQIGVDGVQQHPSTRELATGVERVLLCPPGAVYQAIKYGDVLAAAYARLLLWRLPESLPQSPSEVETSWQQYIAAWRPGKPHRDRWAANWRQAWAVA